MVLKDLITGREEVLQEEEQCGSLHGLPHGEKSVANVVSLHESEEEEGWPTQTSQNVSCDSWRVSKAGMP